MNEFLSQNYFLITYSVEVLAAVTGIFCYKKQNKIAAKYFIFFLVYSFLVDFIGSNYPLFISDNGFLAFLDNTPFESNFWWYNFFARIGFPLFIALIFYNTLYSPIYKMRIMQLAVLFTILSMLHILFYFDMIFKVSSTFLSILSLILILCCLMFYFIEILNSDKVLYFYKSLFFYISSTFLIWWLITTPIIFFNIYFSSADWNFVFLKWQIFLFANIFMYLTFTFALIFCKPKYD